MGDNGCCGGECSKLRKLGTKAQQTQSVYVLATEALPVAGSQSGRTEFEVWGARNHFQWGSGGPNLNFRMSPLAAESLAQKEGDREAKLEFVLEI